MKLAAIMASLAVSLHCVEAIQNGVGIFGTELMWPLYVLAVGWALTAIRFLFVEIK